VLYLALCPIPKYCSSVVDPDSSFCARHAASEPSDSQDFSAALTDKACRFQNAQGINYSLGALYTLCAQGRISPRRASTLAYISSLLLRSLTAIDTDLYPKPGAPALTCTANLCRGPKSTRSTTQLKRRSPPNRKSLTDRAIFIAPHG
jgi:hypothetical protein